MTTSARPGAVPKGRYFLPAAWRGAPSRALGGADGTEVRLRFVELHYGRDLADAVRLQLRRQRE